MMTTANDICKMIEFLVDNTYVKFSGQLFRQTVGILVGTNCDSLLADLFLYSYKYEFLDKLIRDGKRTLARQFSLSLIALSLSITKDLRVDREEHF